MNIDVADLQARFRDMSDEELLQRAGTHELIDQAQQLAEAELRVRGLRLPELVREELPAPEPGTDPLKVCARFLLPLDAEVFAARLVQEGIAAQVADADAVYGHGALLFSMDSSGVRVMVPASQLERALRVREALDAGEFAIDENFDVGAPPR
jgi:hypothetical protein